MYMKRTPESIAEKRTCISCQRRGDKRGQKERNPMTQTIEMKEVNGLTQGKDKRK